MAHDAGRPRPRAPPPGRSCRRRTPPPAAPPGNSISFSMYSVTICSGQMAWLTEKQSLSEELRVALEPGRADARDARRDVEDRVPHLAGDEVRLVARGHREEHVGVGRAGLGEHLGVRRVADDRAQVELVLQVLQALGAGVDDGDVVLLRDQALGHAGADLAGAEDEDLQVGSGLLRCSTAGILRRAGRSRCRLRLEGGDQLHARGRAGTRRTPSSGGPPAGGARASRPTGATKTLVTEMPRSAGRYT